MTKAAQIMALHAQGLSTREIALAVYGEVTEARLAYVRVVVNQRKGGGQSKHDVAYLAKPAVRAKHNARMNKRNAWRWHNDPDYRNRHLAARKLRRARQRALTTATNHIMA